MAGLFACYDAPGVPRTNNDLEQAFGSHRYHERRATGRKGASPALVLRGVAGLATRTREVTAADLAGADRVAWNRLRAELETRRERRAEHRRFRRDPDGHLKVLKNKLIQSRLPTSGFARRGRGQSFRAPSLRAAARPDTLAACVV